jgi:hypothetical protein
MAPEQFDDPDHVDFRADIYGLGCVLYYILTGEAAFPETTIGALVLRKSSGSPPDPRKLKPSVRPEIASLVHDLLAAKREARPQSYEALIARCDAILGGKPAVSPSTPTIPIERAAVAAPPVPPKPRTFHAGLVVAAIVAAAAAAAFLLVKPSAPPQPPQKVAAPVIFGTPQRLFALDPNSRVADWRRHDGSADWGPEEEGDGVNGVGTGAVGRDLGPGPWRAEGRILPINPVRGTGARVDLKDGRGAGLIVQNLEGTFSVSAVRFKSDGSRDVLKTTFVTGKEDVSFALTVERDRVRIEAESASMAEVPLDGAEAAGLSLFVQDGPARFRDLRASRPKSP